MIDGNFKGSQTTKLLQPRKNSETPVNFRIVFIFYLTISCLNYYSGFYVLYLLKSTNINLQQVNHKTPISIQQVNSF